MSTISSISNLNNDVIYPTPATSNKSALTRLFQISSPQISNKLHKAPFPSNIQLDTIQSNLFFEALWNKKIYIDHQVSEDFPTLSLKLSTFVTDVFHIINQFELTKNAISSVYIEGKVINDLILNDTESLATMNEICVTMITKNKREVFDNIRRLLLEYFGELCTTNLLSEKLSPPQGSTFHYVKQFLIKTKESLLACYKFKSKAPNFSLKLQFSSEENLTQTYLTDTLRIELPFQFLYNQYNKRNVNFFFKESDSKFIDEIQEKKAMLFLKAAFPIIYVEALEFLNEALKRFDPNRPIFPKDWQTMVMKIIDQQELCFSCLKDRNLSDCLYSIQHLHLIAIGTPSKNIDFLEYYLKIAAQGFQDFDALIEHQHLFQALEHSSFNFIDIMTRFIDEHSLSSSTSCYLIMNVLLGAHYFNNNKWKSCVIKVIPKLSTSATTSHLLKKLINDLQNNQEGCWTIIESFKTQIVLAVLINKQLDDSLNIEISSNQHHNLIKVSRKLTKLALWIKICPQTITHLWTDETIRLIFKSSQLEIKQDYGSLAEKLLSHLVFLKPKIAYESLSHPLPIALEVFFTRDVKSISNLFLHCHRMKNITLLNWIKTQKFYPYITNYSVEEFNYLAKLYLTHACSETKQIAFLVLTQAKLSHPQKDFTELCFEALLKTIFNEMMNSNYFNILFQSVFIIIGESSSYKKIDNPQKFLEELITHSYQWKNPSLRRKKNPSLRRNWINFIVRVNKHSDNREYTPIESAFLFAKDHPSISWDIWHHHFPKLIDDNFLKLIEKTLGNKECNEAI
ncbi:MAG: hypothetical protein JHC93_07575, partial [Parachlamydiales bacterium]|nr:hypothetical protein [Parachlamydiales bacterium]